MATGKTWISVALGLTAILALLLRPAPAARSAPQALPGEVQISNVRDTSLSVSWVSSESSPGQVRYGTNPSRLTLLADDKRGAGTEDDTHYITLSGLTPDSLYYFDLVIAGGIDNNGGAHYRARTGPALPLPASDTVYGRVFKSNGTDPAAGAIVNVILSDDDSVGSSGNAAPLSSLADANGYWSVNLGNARTADLSGLFSYSASGDNLGLEADGAADGDNSATIDTADDTPAASITLSLGAATSTPTATAVPTDTPTPGGVTDTPTTAPSATPTATPTSAALLANLVAYWKMNETSGNRVDSHSTRHLTDNNTVGFGAGKLGNAAEFISANSEYLSSNDSALNFGTGDFSISLWLNGSNNITTASSGARLVQRRGTGAWGSVPGWVLKLRRDGTDIYFTEAGIDDGTAYSAFPNSLLGTTATWMHVVLTVDRTADVAKVYKDNNLVFTHSISAVAGSVDSSRNFTFGASDVSLVQFLDGLIDEGGAWSRVLSAGDVSELWNSGSGVSYPFGAGGTATPTTTATATITPSPTTIVGPSPTAGPTATPLPGSVNTIIAGHGYAFPSQAASVPLTLELLPGSIAGSVTVFLQYDPTIVWPATCDVDPGNAWDSRLCNLYFDSDNDGQADAVRINAASVSGVSGTVTLANVAFETVGKSGQISPLTAVADTLKNPSGAALPVTVQHGSVRVQQLGDVDCDNTVTSADSSLVLQFDAAVLGSGILCPPAVGTLFEAACDVNDSATCDIGDALMILQCDVGLVNGLCPATANAAPHLPLLELTDHQDQATNTVSIDSGAVQSGAVLHLPLKARINSGRVGGLSVEVRYDPDQLSVYGCQKDPDGRFDSSLCNATHDRDGDGRADTVKLSMIAVGGLAGELKLADIVFRGAGPVGTRATVEVRIERLLSASGKPVEAEAASGSVEIIKAEIPVERVEPERIYLPLTRRR